MDEIGGYLAGPDAPVAERHALARAALARGRAGFEAFVNSRLPADAVVLTEITITRRCGHVQRYAFGVPPGPIALLVFCASNCGAGDELTLRQVTALGGTVTTAETWPFGLAAAEQLTIPAAARLASARRRAERE